MIFLSGKIEVDIPLFFAITFRLYPCFIISYFFIIADMFCSEHKKSSTFNDSCLVFILNCATFKMDQISHKTLWQNFKTNTYLYYTYMHQTRLFNVNVIMAVINSFIYIFIHIYIYSVIQSCKHEIMHSRDAFMQYSIIFLHVHNTCFWCDIKQC